MRRRCASQHAMVLGYKRHCQLDLLNNGCYNHAISATSMYKCLQEKDENERRKKATTPEENSNKREEKKMYIALEHFPFLNRFHLPNMESIDLDNK